jgi:hypothetical protein
MPTRWCGVILSDIHLPGHLYFFSLFDYHYLLFKIYAKDSSGTSFLGMGVSRLLSLEQEW